MLAGLSKSCRQNWALIARSHATVSLEIGNSTSSPSSGKFFWSSSARSENSLTTIVGGISRNNGFGDYIYLSEFCFSTRIQSDLLLPFVSSEESEMDSKIEWQKSDSSKFIFHYRLTMNELTRVEKKENFSQLKSECHFCRLIYSQKKNTSKTTDDDECLSLALAHCSDRGKWQSANVKRFDGRSNDQLI